MALLKLRFERDNDEAFESWENKIPRRLDKSGDRAFLCRNIRSSDVGQVSVVI